MGIQELSIKGFRSLRDVTWRPGKLNVVIGPNGSGKSNLLTALELLRSAARGELAETILRMGGLAPLLWDGQAQELAWVARLDHIAQPTAETERFTYELRLGIRQVPVPERSSRRHVVARTSRRALS